MLAAVRRRATTHACLAFRRISTSHFDPTIRDFARTLIQKQPCVAMSADDVNILSEPTGFHERLLVSTASLSIASS
jgi:hypothetical protein